MVAARQILEMTGQDAATQCDNGIGAWRDHRIYAITKEEVPDGVLTRLRASGGAAHNPEPQ